MRGYQEASRLKSEESYPKNKIAEINDILAKQQSELAAEQAEEEANYQAAIQEGDAAFSSEEYQLASKAYERALEIKPNEAYPANQLGAIEKLMRDKAARQEEIRLQQEREAKNEAAYQTAIATADRLFDEQKWSEAKNEYQLALGLKPSEAYPQNQIDAIQRRLDQIAAAKLAKENEALQEERFKEHMNNAQKGLETSSYSLAKREYEMALSIKPGDSYASSQLEKVIKILEERRKKALAKKEAEENKPIVIKEGPKATIDGNAEEEIERLYKEMWAKRNVDKNEWVQEKQETVSKLNAENQEKEFQKRQNALEEIEAISISMREELALTDEIHLQNYETVKQKTSDVVEAETELARESERKRNENYSNESDQSEVIREFQIERNDAIVEGKKEMVENEYEEVRVTNERWEREQGERREATRDEYVMKQEEIREDQLERTTATITKNAEDIKETEENWDETVKEYIDDSYERISDEQQRINDRQVSEQQFKNSGSDNYMENQQIIEEKEKVLKEETESWNSESEQRRQDNADEEYYQGEDRPRQDPRASEFKQGVTEEIIENQNNSTTIRRTVVNGTEVDVYEKTFFSWGAVYYTKNGNNITEETWDAESK